MADTAPTAQALRVSTEVLALSRMLRDDAEFDLDAVLSSLVTTTYALAAVAGELAQAAGEDDRRAGRRLTAARDGFSGAGQELVEASAARLKAAESRSVPAAARKARWRFRWQRLR